MQRDPENSQLKRRFAVLDFAEGWQGCVRKKPGILLILISYFESPLLTVIASEAKQSILSSCGDMDCFAALAMTWK